MKYITIIQVVIRSIVTVLIFILIKEESDYLLLVLLNSIAQIMIGMLGLIIAKVKFKIKFRLPSFEEIRNQLKSGWNIFQSMIAINIYTTSNTFILGLFASETIVGYYAAADKIRMAFQGVISVLSQTAFPYVNSLLTESYNKFIRFIKKLFIIETCIGTIMSLLLFIFSDSIIKLFLGSEFLYSINILKILSPLPFIISISTIFGIQIMIPLGNEKSFKKIISLAAFIHIILLAVLIPKLNAIGTSIAVVVTESLISFSMLLFVNGIRHRSKVLRKK